LDKPKASVTAVLKVGSTSVSVLVADRVGQPLWETQAILSLLGDPHAEAKLDAWLGTWSWPPSARPAWGLAALGAVGRERPGLAEPLKRRGWEVWLLSGEEEAWAAWWGEQAFWPHPVTVIDVGGGSTEFAGPGAVLSLPVGAARPPSPDTAVSLPEFGGREAVALGGSARALARVLGTPLSRSALVAFRRQPPERPPDIEPARWALLDGGAAAWLWVLEALGRDAVPVSPRDLRWGLFLAARLGRGKGFGHD
jgi:hypothetical protein